MSVYATTYAHANRRTDTVCATSIPTHDAVSVQRASMPPSNDARTPASQNQCGGRTTPGVSGGHLYVVCATDIGIGTCKKDLTQLA
eukprot:9469320-Pyramimonas_sp.AAC.1